MRTISPSLRQRINAVAYQLIAIGKDLQAIEPNLAKAYTALGQGIEGSHYRTGHGHDLWFDIPAHCECSVSRSDVGGSEGPKKLHIAVYRD